MLYNIITETNCEDFPVEAGDTGAPPTSPIRLEQLIRLVLSVRLDDRPTDTSAEDDDDDEDDDENRKRKRERERERERKWGNIFEMD